MWTTFSPTALPLTSSVVTFRFLRHHLLPFHLVLSFHPHQASVRHIHHPILPTLSAPGPFKPLYFSLPRVRIRWKFLLPTLLISSTPNLQFHPFSSLAGENRTTLANNSTHCVQDLVFSGALSLGLFLNSNGFPSHPFLTHGLRLCLFIGHRFGGCSECTLGTVL